MKEMMEAKLMAVRKLKKLMQGLMNKNDEGEASKNEMVETTPAEGGEASYEIGEEEMEKPKYKKDEDEDDMPRKSGRTKPIMMSVGTHKPKFMKK